jgi:hypothetical protein
VPRLAYYERIRKNRARPCRGYAKNNSATRHMYTIARALFVRPWTILALPKCHTQILSLLPLIVAVTKLSTRISRTYPGKAFGMTLTRLHIGLWHICLRSRPLLLAPTCCSGEAVAPSHAEKDVTPPLRHPYPRWCACGHRAVVLYLMRHAKLKPSPLSQTVQMQCSSDTVCLMRRAVYKHHLSPIRQE